MKDASSKLRLAANRLVADGHEVEIHPVIIELEGTRVTSVRCLDGESAFVEWLGGTITTVTAADGSVRAYKDGVLLGVCN